MYILQWFCKMVAQLCFCSRALCVTVIKLEKISSERGSRRNQSDDFYTHGHHFCMNYNAISSCKITQNFLSAIREAVTLYQGIGKKWSLR